VKRVLVPLDGTRHSEAVLPLAAAVARGHGAEVLLVRALRWQGFPEAQVAASEEAEGYLARIAEDLAAEKVPARWTTCRAEPDHAIAAAARDSDADLVAMATHGRGAVTPSVAERVVRQTSAPVLLVRAPLVWPRGDIGTIVVPLDGSGLSEAILPLVARLAMPFDFAIDLLRVVEPVPAYAPVDISAATREEMRQRETLDARGYLARVGGALEERGVRVTRSIAYGPTGDVIVRHAGDTGAGLIAMSTHGRTGLGRLLLGSVAECVLRAAARPVLLWKAPAVGSRCPV
jgi:nucleotide-binding universal stress UspA family protein